MSTPHVTIRDIGAAHRQPTAAARADAYEALAAKAATFALFHPDQDAPSVKEQRRIADQLDARAAAERRPNDEG
jgi:hypothetical protein